MATNTNIGNLSAILTADASQLVGELNRAANAMEQTSQSIATNGAKATKSVSGMGNRLSGRFLLFEGFRLASKEIEHVIQNIDNIPGVPASAIESVHEFGDALHETRDTIDLWVAKGISWVMQFSQALGASFAMMANAGDGLSNDFSSLSKLDTPDERARSTNKNYDAQVIQAREKLADATHKAALAGKDLSVQYTDLIKQEQMLLTVSKDTNTLTTLQILQNKTKAVQLDGEAKTKLKQIDDQFQRSEEALTKSYDRQNVSIGGAFQIRSEMIGKEGELEAAIKKLGPVNLADAANTEKRTELTKQLTAAINSQIKAEDTIVKASRQHQAALDAVANAQEGAARKSEGLNQQLAELRTKLAEIDQERAGLNTGSSVPDLERDTQLLKEKAKLLAEVGQITKQIKQPALELTNSFAQGFQQLGDQLAAFVVKGKMDLTGLLQSVEQSVISTFLKLALINPMVNGLFAGAGSLFNVTRFSALPMLGFASGGTPPVGAPSIVGENGPELFVPKTQGTIIPNNQLSSGKSGNHYYIDARGADAGQISVLKSMIQALNASVEDRAVSAVLMQQRRRGTMGNSLLGYS